MDSPRTRAARRFAQWFDRARADGRLTQTTFAARLRQRVPTLKIAQNYISRYRQSVPDDLWEPIAAEMGLTLEQLIAPLNGPMSGAATSSINTTGHSPASTSTISAQSPAGETEAAHMDELAARRRVANLVIDAPLTTDQANELYVDVMGFILRHVGGAHARGSATPEGVTRRHRR